MKNIFLAVSLLVGCIGVANAEIDGKRQFIALVDGEVPANVMREYNAAQSSLHNLRNKYINEADQLVKVSDYQKAYTLSCVQLPQVINNLVDNDTALLKHLRYQSSIRQVKNTIATNKKVLSAMDLDCKKIQAAMQDQ